MTKPRREQVGPGGDPVFGSSTPAVAGQRESSDAAEVNPPAEQVNGGVVVDCGWGRLVFGQTFPEPSQAADVLRAEALGQRDICMYLPDPHVLVARRPGELFIDPSYTYRLDLPAQLPTDRPAGLTVRTLRDEADAEVVNGIYARNRMITAPVETLADNARTPIFEHLVAEDSTGQIVGTVTGVDHVEAFGDEQRGTSLWCLTVDGQLAPPGTGVTLISELAQRFADKGRAHIDLSVLADNSGAIRLYERLGFRRVQVLCVKRKNPINETLFTGVSPDGYDELNPYARIIADEARRRGITVEVIDPSWGEMRLTYGGRSLVTRESLSELTTAVAMSRCDDKRVTRRLLSAAGLRVPHAHTASYDEHDEEFLRRTGSLVVKPARGEQGAGISIGVVTPEQLQAAITEAHRYCPDVLLEEFVSGEDLRVVVINDEVVAAAIRRPATVIGTGRHPIRTLVERQSKRRSAATHGESQIPMDEITEQIVRDAGYTMDDVLPEGQELRVRRTANLHTGGTIHDVTADLHPDIVAASIRAARAIDIPVTGLDLLVPDAASAEHVFIEANERPGLANHEPQPTAEKFVDLLFPASTSIPRHWEPSGAISVDHRVEASAGRG